MKNKIYNIKKEENTQLSIPIIKNECDLLQFGANIFFPNQIS